MMWRDFIAQQVAADLRRMKILQARPTRACEENNFAKPACGAARLPRGVPSRRPKAGRSGKPGNAQRQGRYAPRRPDDRLSCVEWRPKWRNRLGLDHISLRRGFGGDRSGLALWMARRRIDQRDSLRRLPDTSVPPNRGHRAVYCRGRSEAVFELLRAIRLTSLRERRQR